MFKKCECRLFQTLLSSNAVRNLCISACTYFGSAVQTRLFFWQLHAIPSKCSANWQFQGLSFLCSHSPPRPYIHDGLGMVPQTRQAESGLQASHRPCETLQHGRGSPEAQAATLQLIELAALGEHLEGVLEERVEVWIRIIPARSWVLSGRHLRQDPQLLKTGQRRFSRGGAAQLQHVRCSFTCQMQRPVQKTRTPCRFLLPPLPLLHALCPCHFTVGHAAFFFRVTGQGQWRLENTRNFFLFGEKKWGMGLQLWNERV